MTIEERVQKGAAFLDTKIPGWWNRINTSTLDVGGLTNCPLGQLCRNYVTGARHLGLFRSEDCVKLGFESDRYSSGAGEVRRDYDTLNVAWLAEIERRRKEEEVARDERRRSVPTLA